MDAIAWVEQGKQQLQWSLWTIVCSVRLSG